MSPESVVRDKLETIDNPNKNLYLCDLGIMLEKLPQSRLDLLYRHDGSQTAVTADICWTWI